VTHVRMPLAALPAAATAAAAAAAAAAASAAVALVAAVAVVTHGCWCRCNGAEGAERVKNGMAAQRIPSERPNVCADPVGGGGGTALFVGLFW